MTPAALFYKLNIFDLLQHQQQELKSEVDRLQMPTIERVPEELVRELAGKYKLEMPVLDEDHASTSHREVAVEAGPSIWDDFGPHSVKGTEVTVSIPFKGNPVLFDVRPTTYSTDLPRGEVHDNELHLIFTRTDTNAAALKADYERTLKTVKQYLAWLEPSLADFNSKIGQQAQGLLTQRRQRLAAAADMVAGIGLPVRRKNGLAESDSKISGTSLSKSISSPKKWDVFISHATEDKGQLVRPLAEALRKAGIGVWYDEFTLKMGDSLRASIDYGLANSRYGVVVLSKNFFEKHWPAQELNGLAGREANGKKVILPIWHNVNADQVREFSPILADRVATPSDAGLERLVTDIIQALDQD